MGVLEELVDEGKIREIGCSNFTAETAIATDSGPFRPASLLRERAKPLQPAEPATNVTCSPRADVGRGLPAVLSAGERAADRKIRGVRLPPPAPACSGGAIRAGSVR